MTEYIKREEAIKSIMGETPDAHYPHWYADKIKSIQPADVASVVHGKWIDVREKRLFGDHYFICSNCKSRNGSMILFNYCPNCGAKMDLES